MAGNKKQNPVLKLAKIEKLPKTVQDTIPFEGFLDGGIIETAPGVFTKTYKLKDINFANASDEDELNIFHRFESLLNSFDPSIKWEFTIHNHRLDKRETLKKIRVIPAPDGLNRYRQELNDILLQNMKKGDSTIVSDKYLTVSVEDRDVEHAVKRIKKAQNEIRKKMKKMDDSDALPLSSFGIMKLLYDIYNPGYDYRATSGIYENRDKFQMGHLNEQGISIKDVIGPTSFDFTKKDRFQMGETYGRAMFLKKLPSSSLTTGFIKDMMDIQGNVLISTSHEAIRMDEATKMVNSKIATLDGKAADIQKRNGENGYYGGLPRELEIAQENARDLMTDLVSRDQKLFYITFTVVVFADNEQKLDELSSQVKDIAEQHGCTIAVLDYQQEQGLNTALPLCKDQLFVDRLYTTESASIFIPFSSEELIQENAIFYGRNQTTQNMILYNRMTGDNYNGLIFGMPGSGKSFTAKFEMVSTLLTHPNSQVFVIDPQGEYYPLANALGGQEITLSPGSSVNINPLDMNITASAGDDVDPVAMKSDFIISMFDIIAGKNREIAPAAKACLDKAIKKVYAGYLRELEARGIAYDKQIAPTLSDLYHELKLMASERYEAKELADMIEPYAVGTFDTFAHRTNIDTDKRFVVYNTKSLGTGMKELGLHLSINDVWNRMIENSKKGIYTWLYIDEFHVLLESESTTAFLKQIWKMARKWMGVPTGIMQNTEDLLRDADTRAIVNTTSFVIMLREPLMDRNNLMQLFSLSQSQADYIADSDKGHGLLRTGKTTLKFGFDFPKDTELYSIMTTAHDVKDAKFK